MTTFMSTAALNLRIAQIQRRPPSSVPTLMAATGFQGAFLQRAFTFRLLHREHRSDVAPMIAAIRVPPSACNTSRSIQSFARPTSRSRDRA